MVANAIVVWNTVYMQKAIEALQDNGEEIKDEDIAMLSPLISHHINILGKYSFILPDAVRDGKLRDLNDI